MRVKKLLMGEAVLVDRDSAPFRLQGTKLQMSDGCCGYTGDGTLAMSTAQEEWK
jgi:hypothetical protein